MVKAELASVGVDEIDGWRGVVAIFKDTYDWGGSVKSVSRGRDYDIVTVGFGEQVQVSKSDGNRIVAELAKWNH